MSGQGSLGGERLSQAEVARKIGRDPSVVSRFLASRPWLKGPDGLVDLAAYLREHDLATRANADTAKERSTRAQAELRELELRHRRGELKPAALIARLVEEAIGELLQGIDSEIEEALVQAGVAEVGEARSAVGDLIHRSRERFAGRMRELAAADEPGGGGE